MRVLITDTHYKNGLCAVRSLGRHGAWVLATAPRAFAAGAHSRFADARAVYPPPASEDAFMSFLTTAVRRHKIDVVLPLSQQAVDVVARNRAVITAEAQVALADWSKIDLAGNKDAAIDFARTVGVPTPRTYDSPDEVDRFPVVVKEVHGSGGVRYANSPAELQEAFSDTSTIQEFIPGEGYGFFGLFSNGVERAIFMHRRIREYPVTGGASTAAESFYDERLRDHGLRLLRALEWHGVAMAEFKRDDRDGEYKLIEINPKFWGSLDLAVAAGVDFPWLTARLAHGDELDYVGEYEVGLRFHWVFDDLLHLLARPRSAPSITRDFLDRSVRSDLVLSDLKPTAIDAVRFAGSVARRVRAGSLRRPHGSVEQAG